MCADMFIDTRTPKSRVMPTVEPPLKAVGICNPITSAAGVWRVHLFAFDGN